MTVVMQFTHRHLAALFHLYSAYLFRKNSFLQNLWDLELLAERQMPVHHSSTVFSPLRQPAQSLPLNLSLY